MASIPLVGVDPSLRNWGLALGWYDTERKQLSIAAVRVIQPVLPSKKSTRQSAIDLMAAEQLTEGFIREVRNHGAQCSFVEIPHGSQSAMAMKGYGICIGVLGALRATGLPFFELNQREVKMATLGKDKATKQEMIDWVSTHHPETVFPTRMLKGQPSVITGKAEHMADAVATLVAGTQSAYFTPFLNR